MSRIFSVFKQKYNRSGYLYFYVHLITELICFYVLGKVIGNNIVLWLSPLIYDTLAFAPQSLIGYVNDKYPKLNFGIIGVLLLTFGLIAFSLNLFSSEYLEIVLVSLGNAFIHIAGAEVTLKSSDGKLSPSAIFVGGGSFGVVAGKLLSSTNVSFWFLTILSLTMIPFIILADMYKNESSSSSLSCQKFNYQNLKLNPKVILLLTVFIVIVRAYMGYGIPTSWNKTAIQTVALYFAMGIGKLMGGILSDTFGAKKIALISIIGALPFLLFGDNLMMISLIGVLLFSLTMPITLGILVSVLKRTPGLAFGLTTIGLLLGTLPIFFVRFSTKINCVIILVLTIICVLIINKVMRKMEVLE
ncbi:MAG: hypothetical protein IJA94_01865 [Bacilli bacterium]|nr:hypothetical protein [Bacilli bacterium]